MDKLMQIDLGKLVELGIMLIAFAFGYGILNQKVCNLEKKFTEFEGLRSEVKQISATLNQLLGKVDTWFQLMEKHKEKEN
jgi:hypothetical protein